MSLKAALARVLSMAAIFAVLAFASSAAEAHGGHVHTGAAPVVLALQAPVQAVSVEKLSIRSELALQDTALNDTALHDHDTAELRATPDTVPADDSAGCIQSCCTSAPCHSSTACTLGAEISIVLPHDAGRSPIGRNVLGIAGCDPEGIRKPPRTFA